MRSRQVFVLVVVSLMGCEPPEEPSVAPPISSVDSAGAQVVVSTAPMWPDGEGWRVDLEPVAIYGGTEDRGGVSIGRLLTAFRLSSGEFVIADELISTLHWIDADGSVTSAGGVGEGPGEFRDLTAAYLAAGDTVVALDRPLRRVSTFNPTGAFVETRPLALGAWEGWQRSDDRRVSPTFAGVLGDQTIVGITNSNFSGPQIGVIRDSVWVVHDPRSPREPWVMGPIPGREYWRGAGWIRAQPLGITFSAAVTDSAIHMTQGKRAEVRTFRPDGTLQRVARIDRPLRPVDEDLVSTMRERLTAQQVASQRDRTRERLEGIEFPDSVPDLGGLVVDSEGNSWVRRYRLETGPDVYDVIDQDGIWLGPVEVPSELEILQIGVDFIVAAREDEFDVDEVVVLRIMRE